jgi:hypothetical protein
MLVLQILVVSYQHICLCVTVIHELCSKKFQQFFFAQVYVGPPLDQFSIEPSTPVVAIFLIFWCSVCFVFCHQCILGIVTSSFNFPHESLFQLYTVGMADRVHLQVSYQLTANMCEVNWNVM